MLRFAEVLAIAFYLAWIFHISLAAVETWIHCSITDEEALIASDVTREVHTQPSFLLCTILAANRQWPGIACFENDQCTLWDKAAHIAVRVKRERFLKDTKCVMPNRHFACSLMEELNQDISILPGSDYTAIHCVSSTFKYTCSEDEGLQYVPPGIVSKECNDDFIPSPVGCLYLDTTSNKNYDNARQFCLDLDADLVSTNTHQEYLDLVAFVAANYDHKSNIWAGVRAVGNTLPYDWRWIGNGRLTGDDFEAESIPPSGNSNSIVTRMRKSIGWKMDDGNCINKFTALCQRR